MSDIKGLIDKKDLEDVEKIFKKTKIGNEFEFMFYTKKDQILGNDNYINLLKYFKIISKKQNYDITPIEKTLELIYSPDSETNYRLSINNDKIDHYTNKITRWKRYILLNHLINSYIDGDTGITVLKKNKNKENLKDIDNFNMRVRLSDETLLENKKELEKINKIEMKDNEKIIFRYKKRISFYVLGNKNSKYFIRVDFTQSKTSPTYEDLTNIYEDKEVEVEYGTKNEAKKEHLDQCWKLVEMIHKIIQQSSFLITKEDKKKVLSLYQQLTDASANRKGLIARKPITLEITDLENNLPNNYAVTDKADGERMFLIIFDKRVYFISNNLEVKFSGIEVDKQFNNTILDGEFIFIRSKNKQLFMAFDCLFYKGEDLRNIERFLDRIDKLDKLINEVFTNKKHKKIKLKNYPEDIDYTSLEKLNKFHKEQLSSYHNSINEDLGTNEKYPLIRRKYFIPVLGLYPWEIYSYSVMMWNLLTRDEIVHAVYSLDGLVYHPLYQTYEVKKDKTKFNDLKWKPPEMNTIDFYITFDRDEETGDVIDVYDNAETKFMKNTPYRVCYLNVSQPTKHDNQKPVFFRPEENLHIANIFLDNGEIRDSNGNIIVDKTVVEFYYSSEENLSPNFRWVPLRTRHDKTEDVYRHSINYGNNVNVANNVWQSILNPIRISDMEDLSKGNNPEKQIYLYDNKIEDMKNSFKELSEKHSNEKSIYYQKRTDLAINMRKFHNWIKSNLIFTYCDKIYQSNENISVLDLGCGRGGDIKKFYHANVSLYVGVDIDYEGLANKIDGAISRYNDMKRKFKDFPKMEFIHADPGVEFILEHQEKALDRMNEKNKKIFNNYFGNNPVYFDRISCQFTIHYLMRDEIMWNNLKKNINNHLKNNGYFFITTFDMNKIRNLLGDKNKYTMDYTKLGQSKTLFEIVKLYDDNNFNKKKPNYLGNAIDTHLSWIFDSGNYKTEYLVDPQFLVNELINDCNMELVETELFSTIYELNKSYFNEAYKYHPNPMTRKFLENVANFYQDTDINNKTLVFNNLMRYYVFRKIDNPLESKKQYNKNQKGGNIHLDFFDPKQFSLGKSSNNNYSFLNCIFQIIKKYNYVPQSLSLSQFFYDLELEILEDDNIIGITDRSDLENLLKNIIIKNDVDGKVKTFVNGLNVFLLERNCNNDHDIEFINGKGNLNLIILKDGNLYTPVYKNLDNNQLLGLFNKKYKIYKDLKHKCMYQ
jgi:hypothetical protein